MIALLYKIATSSNLYLLKVFIAQYPTHDTRPTANWLKRSAGAEISRVPKIISENQLVLKVSWQAVHEFVDFVATFLKRFSPFLSRKGRGRRKFLFASLLFFSRRENAAADRAKKPKQNLLCVSLTTIRSWNLKKSLTFFGNSFGMSSSSSFVWS